MAVIDEAMHDSSVSDSQDSVDKFRRDTEEAQRQTEFGHLSRKYILKRAYARGQNDHRVFLLRTGHFFSCRDIFLGVINAEIN